MSSTTRAYRIDDALIAHLEYASKMSKLSKTAIVENALQRELENKYPLPVQESAAAKTPMPIF